MSETLEQGIRRVAESDFAEGSFIAYASDVVEILDKRDAELSALRERRRKVEDAALIAGNLLTDVKEYLETKVRKTSVSAPMEDEIDILKYINAFQDLHGELVKELGEKYAASRGES